VAASLDGLRVLDLTTGISGAYCTKLLGDAGADIVMIESSTGHPLRQRTAFRRRLEHDEDGALFQFLAAGKRSVVSGLETDHHGGSRVDELDHLLERVDVVVEDADPARGGEMLNRHPELIVVTLSAFGCDGPWTERAASDLTLQALSSSIAGRGERSKSPVMAGGELIEWTSGTVGAIGALLALRRHRLGGGGDHVDVSKLEVAVTIFNAFHSVAGQIVPPKSPPFRGVEVPSIEPTADGWVGLCTLGSDQFAQFAEMIGHPEWGSDPEISWQDVRMARSAELRPLVGQWTRSHTTEEILDEAARRRIPAAPVGNGELTPRIAHLVEREVFEVQPVSGFIRPRVPYLMSRSPRLPVRESPLAGSMTLSQLLDEWNERANGASKTPGSVPHSPMRPLEGIRVFDFTTFWAGPLASLVLASFGADVIKVESVQRPDGIRMASSYGISGDLRWEKSPLFQGANFDKRGVTLDLSCDEGRQLGKDLLRHCDILIENYSARVSEQFGLLDDLRPDLIVLRIPAWGTSGPYRDAPGFAQNMEQASGLAWVTGYEDGPPLAPRGACDPNGGLHAAFAAMIAVLERDRTGLGQVVEVPLIETALNVAAEQFIEFSAYGDLIGRMGNRSRHHAPHNVYPCQGTEEWVAIAVTDDDQWRRLREALGRPAWTDDKRLASTDGRLECVEALDEALGAWCAIRTPEEVVETLWRAGVPAAALVAPQAVINLPTLRERDFFELVEHPILGPLRVPRFPARFASGAGRGAARPAPTLGQHNREVLVELLGCSDAQIEALEDSDVIGSRPVAPKPRPSA
jgi:crotonobetainyl-CoA:carnitine CoA-transferase CaiB-like acyl-CoA transferase